MSKTIKPATSPLLHICAIGGYGRFGQNCTVYFDDQCALVVDCGIRFDQPIPSVRGSVVDDIRLLEQYKGQTFYLITHGHEDHVGGLDYLAARYPGPIITTAFTARLLRGRIRDHSPIQELDQTSRLNLGRFEIEYVRMSHSIPDTRGLYIKHPSGSVFHTADFKLAPPFIKGSHLAIEGLPAWSHQRKVDLLFCDSTNALQAGFCPGEDVVLRSFESLLQDGVTKMVFSCFSSHVERIEAIGRTADRYGYRLSIESRSMRRFIEAALDTNHLQNPVLMRQALQPAPQDHPKTLRFLAGTQGETESALRRFAENSLDHSEEPSRVVISARTIPGNESSVRSLVQLLLKGGHDLRSSHNTAGIHVSGHAYREDIRSLILALKPKYVIPMHGDEAMLSGTASVAEECLGAHRSFALRESEALVWDGQNILPQSPQDYEVRWIGQSSRVTLGEPSIMQRQMLSYYGMMTIHGALSKEALQFVIEPSVQLLGFECDLDLEQEIKNSIRNCLPLDARLSLHESRWVLEQACEKHMRKLLRPCPVILCQFLML